MPGRVLNFSEFFSKYSKDGENNQKSVADITKASEPFQTAFDETTYKQDNLGPNRPVAGAEGLTPAQPGETGAPKFTPTAKAPSPEETPEQEEQETPEKEEKETPADTEHPENEETPEAETEEEETEEETPEPEANEALKSVKGFTEYINEDYVFGDSEKGSTGEDAEVHTQFNTTLGHSDDEEVEDDEVICQSCGAHKPLDGNSPDEDTWYNENEGMQCGCN